MAEMHIVIVAEIVSLPASFHASYVKIHDIELLTGAIIKPLHHSTSVKYRRINLFYTGFSLYSVRRAQGAIGTCSDSFPHEVGAENESDEWLPK